MPLRHMVLIELKPETPSATVQGIVDALRALPAQIEAIRSYEVNVDLGLVDGNATIGVVAGFDDVEGWRTYGPHPAHQAVVQELIVPSSVRRIGLQADLPPCGETGARGTTTPMAQAKGSARRLLGWLTGDRGVEAAGAVEEQGAKPTEAAVEDTKVAVKQDHGDYGRTGEPVDGADR